MTNYGRGRRRLHLILDLLEEVVVALLPVWLRPPGRTPEHRRAAALLWATLLAAVGLLALGAWATGLIPPGAPR